MATIKEKLQGQTSAKPTKIVETDHNNLNISRDEFILKYRKKAEIDAKLELQRKELEAAAEQEMKDLEKVGTEDNAPTEKQEEV